MRRALAVGLGLVLVVGLWQLLPSGRVASEPVTPLQATSRSASEPTRASGIPTADPASEAPPAEQDVVLAVAVRSVQAHCGFGGALRCEGPRCAVLLPMPDLDRIDGWVSLAWHQPAFVATTAARDLGLPHRWTPCASALESLPGVASLQWGDDAELWCAGDEALCEQEAASFGVQGFLAPDVRRLAF